MLKSPASPLTRRAAGRGWKALPLCRPLQAARPHTQLLPLPHGGLQADEGKVRKPCPDNGRVWRGPEPEVPYLSQKCPHDLRTGRRATPGKFRREKAALDAYHSSLARLCGDAGREGSPQLRRTLLILLQLPGSGAHPRRPEGDGVADHEGKAEAARLQRLWKLGCCVSAGRLLALRKDSLRPGSAPRCSQKWRTLGMPGQGTALRDADHCRPPPAAALARALSALASRPPPASHDAARRATPLATLKLAEQPCSPANPFTAEEGLRGHRVTHFIH